MHVRDSDIVEDDRKFAGGVGTSADFCNPDSLYFFPYVRPGDIGRDESLDLVNGYQDDGRRCLTALTAIGGVSRPIERNVRRLSVVIFVVVPGASIDQINDYDDDNGAADQKVFFHALPPLNVGVAVASL